MMGWLTVKNWSDFQHYNDRNPPWIKLHRPLLDNYEFCGLPDHAKAHLMLIWLLASQNAGRVPDDPKFLKDKLSLNRPLDLSILIASGFLIPEQDASKPLGLGEKRTKEGEKRRARHAMPDGFGISDAVRRWALAEGHDQIEASLAYFRDYVSANGKIYADWDAALRNCIKADWGNARALARRATVGGGVAPPKPAKKCAKCGKPATGWDGYDFCDEHEPVREAA